MMQLSAINGTYKYDGYLQRIISDTGNCWQNIWVHCLDTVHGKNHLQNWLK